MPVLQQRSASIFRGRLHRRQPPFRLCRTSEGAQAIREPYPEKIVELAEVSDAVNFARSHVTRVGLGVLKELSDAVRGGNALRWAAASGIVHERSALTAAALASRLEPTRRQIAATERDASLALALRAMDAAYTAVGINRDVPSALDAAVPGLFCDASVIKVLVALTRAPTLSADARRGAAFAVAWASDRGSIELEREAQDVWAQTVLEWFVDSHESDLPPLLCTPDFVRRTMSPRAAWGVLARAHQSDTRRARGMFFAVRWLGTFEQFDLASVLGGGSPAQPEALALAYGTDLEETPLVIAMLGTSGNVEEAEALFRDRFGALVESNVATPSVTALMRILTNTGRAQDALRLAQDYHAPLRGRRTLEAEERIDVGIAFAHALLVAADPVSALYACSEGLGLLGKSSTRYAQEPQLIRFQALALRDLGDIRTARKVALDGLRSLELSGLSRSQLLSVVASCLVRQGELDAATVALDEAAGLLPATDWPRELVKVHADRASAFLLSKRDHEALAAAEEALALALNAEDSDLTQVLSIAADAAGRLHLPTATALHQRALAAVEERLGRSARSPGWEVDALRLKAHLLALAGDSEGVRAMMDSGILTTELPSRLA